MLVESIRCGVERKEKVSGLGGLLRSGLLHIECLHSFHFISGISKKCFSEGCEQQLVIPCFNLYVYK